MNIDIRKHIKHNFSNSTKEEIRNSIDASIEEQDEITLPGMGVLFEILWENSTNKEQLLETIQKGLSNNNA